MQQVLILSGISGSGKSTFAKNFCQENPNWLRVNRDEIRKSILSVSLNEYWKMDDKIKSRIEKLVNELQKNLILESLKSGWNLLIDNTHLKLTYINQIIKILENQELTIHFKLIEIPLEEAIERDKNRNDVVGENVIREQFQKLQTLKKNFKFENSIENTPKSPMVLFQDSSLKNCILVDIDGTVADKGSRIAFDWNRVGEDTPKTNVINLVKSLKSTGYEIIFFSGRDSVCRGLTIDWLNHHFGWQLSDYQLFMRPEMDMRKDSIVKKELFDLHIRNQYFVEMVIDDRNQVVDMWRKELGLTCLQVDYGDF